MFNLMSLTPSQEQVLGQIKLALVLVGGIAGTLGYVKPEAVGDLASLAVGLIGLVMILSTSAWSFYNNTRNALVRKVDTIAKDPGSPVQAIITTNTPEGKVMAQSMPGTTTLQAGTIEATAAARAQ